MKTIRFLFPFFFIILLSACSTFETDKPLVQRRIDSLLVSDFFKSSQAAISVYDLTNKKSIYELNNKILFHPGSNQKILTTAAALLFLGNDYNFKTSIFHSGEIRDSVCLGNIYVVGGFDPDFTLRDLDSLVRAIKNYGINEIKGNIYADVSAMDSLYWGNGWMWDDDPGSYLPYLSPLSINKNCIKVLFMPGEIGKPVNVLLSPSNSFFQVENRSKTIESGKSTLAISRDWMNKKNTITIKGELPTNAHPDSISLNLVNPAFYFLDLMRESLSRHKILFNGITDTAIVQVPLTTIFSFERNILPVIKNANKNSDNLNAELLLRAMAFKYYGKNASAQKGIKLIDSLLTLTSLNPKQYRFVDGSGLSFYNLVSAELLINLLNYIFDQQSPVKETFWNSLPIAGVDGTLANRFNKSMAKGHVFAKTGTLSGISTISGYIDTKKGNLLAFSILIQNFVGGSAAAKEIQEKICELFYQEL